MGERGPKPDMVQRFTPAERAPIDQAIIESADTKEAVFERFKIAERGISYRAFCKYAYALEQTARHRYVGELLGRVFGNLPDSDIDVRTRGIMMSMLDRMAADVLHDRELKPRDLRHVVESYDILRKGTIAEAQEERRKAEWEVHRMGGIAEAAVWLKDAVKAEIGSDPGLVDRIYAAIDRRCEEVGRRERDPITYHLVSEWMKKRKGRVDASAFMRKLLGIEKEYWDQVDQAAQENKPRFEPSERFKAAMGDIYNVDFDKRAQQKCQDDVTKASTQSTESIENGGQ